MSQFNLREQLVKRIRRLPESTLPQLEEAIRKLEVKQTNLVTEFATSIAENSDCLQNPEQTFNVQESKIWPHAPIHRLSENGTYIVTAGTLHKQHYFRGHAKLTLLETTLLELAEKYGWQLEAWAVFSNHYHFIAHASVANRSMKSMLSHLHSTTASHINTMDGEPNRQVWHNYWDTELTIETSYLARLNYIHQNAVKHGLVKIANHYPWCSAAWFEKTASPAQVKTIYSFGISKVRVFDDF
jgi:putative transposase